MFDQLSTTMDSKWVWGAVLVAPAGAVLALLIWLLYMTQMPLKSYAGPLDPLSPEQRETSINLSQHVRYLAVTIGERNLPRGGTLPAAAEYLRGILRQSGYAVTQQAYDV